MEFGSFMEFHTRDGMSQAQAFQESFAHVDMAEKLGLDAVWLAEAHFAPTRSVLSSPFMMAAAIAARTRRLKVGTAVLLLPLSSPIRIAEEAATLDHISQGRFEFGVGRSGLPGAYEGYNISYAESRERFQECLDILIKAWTNERFSHHGTFYSYDDVCLVPKPYQSPHPPIRYAATTSDTFPNIGRMGYPLFVGIRTMHLSDVAEQVRSYEQAWREAGHPGPIDISLRVPVYVAETREAALTEPEESFMRQFRRVGGQLASSVASVGASPGEQRAESGQKMADLTWDDVQGRRVAVGTPEMVIEQLQEMRETLDLSGFVIEFNAGEILAPERVAASLRLFCDKVLPAFK
jgi:alkanesulfonate monooxygenase SsuD/methylene tetrahydromethanopterin reductase-like flavin-dependent oxidoreductase (luciferase family)